MLDNKDKQKFEKYIDNIIKDIKTDIERDIKLGISNKQLIDNLINLTANKFTPESKIILASIYDMLKENTLSSDKYDQVKNKAAFYEMNILKELNEKFNFEVPDYIDYKESSKLINKWTESGAVVIAGGVVSITLNTLIPIGIGTIIAGIMAFVLKDESKSMNETISEYLESVKKSILLWIESIERYYDQRIEELEREMVQ